MMDITFSAKNVDLDKKKNGEVVITATNDGKLPFLTEVFCNDDMLKAFTQTNAVDYICEIIGIEGMLSTFEAPEILSSCEWDYVKKYFLEHMNPNEILDHLGYEKFKEQFKDQLAADEAKRPAKKSLMDSI